MLRIISNLMPGYPRILKRLAAAGLSRVLEHMWGGSFGIISASRGRDDDAVRTKELKNLLKQRGYGFIDLQGGYLYKEKGQQKVPQEIRWVWDPISGDMYVGTQDHHSEMTPSGTDWSAVLRGFYFPDKKLIAIRPYFWPDGAHDYWDGDHAELSADIQMTFIMAMKPILQLQDPEVDFQTNIDNSWLQQSSGRYSW